MAEMDDKLAAALALAIARHPRANLLLLASAAGVSKATLYRISPTREGLVTLMLARARHHMQTSLANAELAQPPFQDALERLTANLMTGRELYLLWNASLWMNVSDPGSDDMQGYTASFFSDALEAFFLAGQQAGVFRIDMPSRWLAKSYDFLLYAAIESAQRGEIATVGMPALVNRLFFDGAINAA